MIAAGRKFLFEQWWVATMPGVAIFIVSLGVSAPAAIAALIFLIAIHKLEYFVNARIIGTQINSRAWEMLTVMLAMEATFGVPGLIAAPIFYAYVKEELAANSLL